MYSSQHFILAVFYIYNMYILYIYFSCTLTLFGYWTLNKHYYYVNSTQISDIIKRLHFGKSDRVDDLYSDTFKHGTSLLFQLLLIVCYVMDMHPPVFYMVQLYRLPRTLN